MANVTKETLVNHIKEWVQLDTDMKHLQKEMKDRREKKKLLTNNLVEIMKTNEIDCFDIKNGKMLYTKNNVKSALNKDHLMKCLIKYFEDNPKIDPGDITKFILENREIKQKDNIRIKENKL
jgi:hypothetical protein